jgi:hypothetical protein
MGQSPYCAINCSLPRPFCADTKNAPGKRSASWTTLVSTSTAFTASMIRSTWPKSSGRVEARIAVCRTALPLTRSPSAFSRSACSGRRVSTHTSATEPRWPAYRLPIAPAPTMHTRRIEVPVMLISRVTPSDYYRLHSLIGDVLSENALRVTL